MALEYLPHDIQKGTKVFADLGYRWYELDSIPVELRKYCQFLTEEIFEVFSPVQDGYDFNDS